MGHIHNNLKAIEDSADPQAAAEAVAARYAATYERELSELKEREYMQCLAMAKVAAHWWRLTLERGRAPSLVLEAGFDRGQLGEGLFGDGLIGMIRKMHKPIEPVQYDLFEWALGMLLMEEHANGWRLNRLSTDYHPCRAIYDAGIAAGIDQNNYDLRFPFKTWMNIDLDHVEVRPGDARNMTLLCETKKHAIMTETRRMFEEMVRVTWGEPGPEYGTPEYTKLSNKRNRLYEAFLRVPHFIAGDPGTIAKMLLDYAFETSSMLPLMVGT